MNNGNEKQKLDSQIKDSFGNISEFTKSAGWVKTQYRDKLRQIQEAEHDLTEEYRARLRQAAMDTATDNLLNLKTLVTSALVLLEKRLNERRASLDLSDPALANALKIIEIGGELKPESIDLVVENIRLNNPAALPVVKSAMDSKKITYQGKIKGYVYSVSEVVLNLQTQAAEAFAGPTPMDTWVNRFSLNNFATHLGKLANLEGYGDIVDIFPDREGSDISMRQAAGLQ